VVGGGIVGGSLVGGGMVGGGVVVGGVVPGGSGWLPVSTGSEEPHPARAAMVPKMSVDSTRERRRASDFMSATLPRGSQCGKRQLPTKISEIDMSDGHCAAASHFSDDRSFIDARNVRARRFDRAARTHRTSAVRWYPIDALPRAGA
jgi:hypothetical protein